MRIGVAAAFDRKAANRWRSQRGRVKRRTAKPAGPGLSGAQLEQAVMAIAMTDPSLVAMPGVEPRRMSARG